MALPAEIVAAEPAGGGVYFSTAAGCLIFRSVLGRVGPVSLRYFSRYVYPASSRLRDALRSTRVAFAEGLRPRF